jgi:hypothetical protein
MEFVLIMAIGTLVLFALLGLLWVRRYVFAPRFTNRACDAFITQALAGSTFEVITRDHSQEWEFEGRTVTAHWTSRPAPPPDLEIVVEFDVHPSTHPWSFSRSTFVSIRDEEHLTQLRARAKQLVQSGSPQGSPITAGKNTEGRESD